MKRLFSFFAGLAVTMAGAGAQAAEGMAEEWQLGFQPAASPIMERFDSLHDVLLILIFAISILVLLLLAYICVRFNHKANPTPSKTTHHTMLEVIWTVLPVLILIAIAIPSLRNLNYVYTVPEDADMTLKVVGNQWYWHYEYPDHGGFSFDSNMIQEADLGPDDIRLLSVDNRVVVPVNKVIRVQMTASDVIHNWAVPALGLKKDAIPGHLNEVWFMAERTGTFYGQCSELCGIRHGFMPIVVEVVTEEEFERWVEKAQQEFSDRGKDTTTQFAQAE